MFSHVDAVILHTSTSPNAHLKPVPLIAFKLTDSFWAPRLHTNRDVTLPTQYQLLEETGRISSSNRIRVARAGPFCP
jgi:hypothetical protein